MRRTLLAIAISAILTTACSDSNDDEPAPFDDSGAPSAEVPATPGADPNPMAPLEPGSETEAPVDATPGADPDPMAPLEPGSETEAPVDATPDADPDPMAPLEPETPVDVAPGTSDPETDLEVRAPFDPFRRPEAIDAIESVTEFFELEEIVEPRDDGIELVERTLSAQRPYFEQRETSVPFEGDFLVPGTTESVLIDIDAGGTGTYRDVSTLEDSDTRRLDSRIGTRTYDGTSVTWMGTYRYTDSSSLRREKYDFTTETRSIGERTFLQSGEIRREGSPNVASNQGTIEITYELTTAGPIDGLNRCDPLRGMIVYDSIAIEDDGFTVTNPATETTIEKQDGERYWTVRERNLDGSLRDEYLIASISLAPFCDFPEL